MAQLPLAFRPAPTARFATFVRGGNSVAVAEIERLAHGGSGVALVFGPGGAGKTHLLQAACAAAAEGGRRAMYLPLAEAAVAGAELLLGLDSLDLLALDDLDRIAGDLSWERRLIAVCNDCAARGAALLLATASAPQALAFALPDVASRVAGATACRLKPLDDTERGDALIAHAHARGFELDRDVADYLLGRVARDMTALGAWLDRLDRESLVAKQKLTVPFVRRVLADGE